MQFIDTHCHLTLDHFNLDIDEVLFRASENNITKIIIPSIDIPSIEKAIKLAENYRQIYAAIGLHPNDGNSWEKNTIDKLRTFARHPKVVAIGEIGLDYYWDECPRDKQQIIFEEQLFLAEEVNLPVIIHSRDSLSEVLSTLKKWKSNYPSDKLQPGKKFGILHAFEGDLESAQIANSLGFLIGIGGPVTYKKSVKKQEIAERIDLEWIVLETDSPFLSPMPFRGKRNEPMNIKLIAERIAQIRNIQLKLVSQITTKNANVLFALEY
jgi:TatD DNase family protein